MVMTKRIRIHILLYLWGQEGDINNTPIKILKYTQTNGYWKLEGTMNHSRSELMFEGTLRYSQTELILLSKVT